MHIINKLFAVVVFVVIMAYLPIIIASLLACFVIFWAGLHANGLFYKLTKKIKWVLLAMALVLSLTTPGQYLFNTTNHWTMFDYNVFTLEGLFLAAKHTLYLLAMVATISLLIHSTPKEKLIAGFYQLGQHVLNQAHLKRFVVRLWLVLYYFEHRAIAFKRIQDLHIAFEKPLPEDQALQTVTLSLQPFSVIDALLFLLMITCTFILVSFF